MTETTESPVLNEWLEEVRKASARLDLDYIAHAYRFSEQAHREQQRQSGEVYLTHPMAVALELASLRLDTTTVAAGLLHDILEDTQVTEEQLTEEFGPAVTFLVESVTKISGLEFQSREEVQAENFRKMLISTARDLRVILIKLADRLHNMRTLEHLNRKRSERIAQETLDIYVPLAHRFGINRIKTELEDLAFSVLHPEAYEDLTATLESDKRKKMKALGGVRKTIQREFKEAGVKAQIAWRLKSYYSIWNKIERRDVGLDEVFDIMALRILTGDKALCYHALGIVHSLFVPITERFRDFIAHPKSNMYQSIHTTVIGANGEPVEIQIRTREMHRVAEEGIAAHWKYKSGKSDQGSSWDVHVKWVREVIDLHSEDADAREFLEHLKLELFQNEVFVLTPQGDLLRLPNGATPLDFAFAVHTAVGMHCQGAKVNGRIVPLDRKLKSGDTVEINTSSKQNPNQSWLMIVKTAKARSAIKRYLREEQSEQSIRLGQELLEREVRKGSHKIPGREEMTDLAQSFGFASRASLFEAIGRGTFNSSQVVEKLFPPPADEPEDLGEGFIQRLVDRARSTVKGVSVQGEGNMMINFARCCQPIPGDGIIGYITRGRGVTVHRSDCANLLGQVDTDDRLVEVSWDTERDQSFLVGIKLEARDRSNLLADIGRAISSGNANIQAANIDASGGEAEGRFIIEIRNLQHLQKVLKSLERVKGVERVERIFGGLDG